MASESQTMPNVDVEILLMGMTGVGKSATGNTILKRRHFVSRGGGASITKEFHAGLTNIGGKTVRVTDVPGFQDTDSATPRDQAKLVADELSRALLQVRNGFDAVLLVYPYTRRLTKEDKECIMTFLDLFDKKAFTEHGVLVLTQGDQFRREITDKTLLEWIASENKDQDWLPVLCENRCVLFDNVTDNSRIKDQQLRELMENVSKCKGYEKYIPKICRLDGISYDKFVKSKERLVEYERAMHELSVLDNFTWGDGSSMNITKVQDQTKTIYDLLMTNKIVSDKEQILALKDAGRLYDGSERRKVQARNIIQPLQMEIERKMRDTEFGKVFQSNFFEKFWEGLKCFGEAIASICNIL